MRLFASDRKEYENGGMKRDFIYVKDIVKIIYFFIENLPESGIYNIATGKSESFISIITSIFNELRLAPRFEFEPISPALKDSFPYDVELPIDKLISTGYNQGITPTYDAIKEYLEKYLMKGEFY